MCASILLTWDVLHAPSNKSSLPKKRGSKSHLHPCTPWKAFLCLKKYCFWNQYLLQVIYINRYNSKTSWVARSIMISNRSFQDLKLSYVMPCRISERTIWALIAKPIMTQVVLRLPYHGWKEKSLLCLQIRFASSRVTTADWLIYTRPTSGSKHFLIQSSTVCTFISPHRTANS